MYIRLLLHENIYSWIRLVFLIFKSFIYLTDLTERKRACMCRSIGRGRIRVREPDAGLNPGA